MMTKADYEATADAINSVLWTDKSDMATMTLLTMRLVAAYEQRNPGKFDKARFIEQAWATRDTVSQDWSAR
jgi:hypothetical protein